MEITKSLCTLRTAISSVSTNTRPSLNPALAKVELFQTHCFIFPRHCRVILESDVKQLCFAQQRLISCSESYKLEALLQQGPLPCSGFAMHIYGFEIMFELLICMIGVSYVNYASKMLRHIRLAGQLSAKGFQNHDQKSVLVLKSE